MHVRWTTGDVVTSVYQHGTMVGCVSVLSSTSSEEEEEEEEEGWMDKAAPSVSTNCTVL